MTWLVDHPGQLPEDRRAYDTAAEAEHAAWKLSARAVKGVVWWYCAGVQASGDAPQTDSLVPLVDSDGSVGSKVIRKLLGRQIESEAS